MNNFFIKQGWKYVAVALVMYSVIYGFYVPLPEEAQNELLGETMRNLFFHVPMWFAMMFLQGFSVWHSIQYLRKENIDSDRKASEAINVALLLGVLGMLTGMLWAQYTWGDFWPEQDSKLKGVAVGMLLYAAYIVLRNGIEDPMKKARISAVYNIFAFPLFLVLIKLIPDQIDSLHPGNKGNPAFSQYGQTNTMRMVFYPAVIGWIGIALWMTQMKYRISKIKSQLS